MASVTELSGDYGRTFRNKVVVGSSSYEKMLVRAMSDEGEYSQCILCTAAQGLDLGNERSFLIARLDYVHNSRAIVRLIGIPSQPADRVVDAVFLQVQRGELFEHLIPLLESDYSEPLASLSHGFTAKDN